MIETFLCRLHMISFSCTALFMTKTNGSLKFVVKKRTKKKQNYGLYIIKTSTLSHLKTFQTHAVWHSIPCQHIVKDIEVRTVQLLSRK